MFFSCFFFFSFFFLLFFVFFFFFFFFQAEDGIRDRDVTGVQTCALPIFAAFARPPMVAASAKAARKPNAGWIGSNALAAMKIANVAASTSVASSLDRKSVV